jgi:hypothetical protein
MKKRTITRKKRGGFFFSNKNNVVPLEGCDPNNIVNLHTTDEIHNNYLKCCPKGFFGSKNSTPYCRQLESNYNAAYNNENNAKEYAGMDLEEAQELDMTFKQNPVTTVEKKSWWKWWGGSRKSKKRYKKRSRKSRKFRK